MSNNQPSQSNPIKETFVFFAITLGICYLVLWGPRQHLDRHFLSLDLYLYGSGGATRSPLYNWLGYTPYILVAFVVAVIWNKELKLKKKGMICNPIPAPL